MKSKLIVALAAGCLLALAGTAAAFHDGGVAECQGCHTMHNSLGGSEMAINSPGLLSGNNYLLIGSDASSTCLSCHQTTAAAARSYKSFSTDVFGENSGVVPGTFSPGGDFGWLTKSFSWSAHGSSYLEDGEEHGHSIKAADFGLAPDSRFTGSTAPFGTFMADDLGCNSCHDPHGKGRWTGYAAGLYTGYQTNSPTAGDTGTDTSIDPIIGSGSYGATPGTDEAVGVYRLLGAGDYEQVSATVQPNFPAEPPQAVAPSSYNKTGVTGSMNAWKVRVSYRQGMTDWCLSCHDNIGAPGSTNHHVVTGDLTGETPNWTGVSYQNIYNQYKGSGDLSGAYATAYLSLVPFEDTATDNAVATGDYTAGATTGVTATSQIMCLSCHRAHASGHQSMTRWTNHETMFIEAGAYTAPMGRTQAEWKASYYNLDEGQMATYQRSLCNKCHAKD